MCLTLYFYWLALFFLVGTSLISLVTIANKSPFLLILFELSFCHLQMKELGQTHSRWQLERLGRHRQVRQSSAKVLRKETTDH